MNLIGSIARRRPMRLLGMLAVAWLCTGAALPERGTKSDQEACTPDVFNLCSDFIPDEPKILACLQGKLEQLSPECHKVIGPDEPPRRKKRKSS